MLSRNLARKPVWTRRALTAHHPLAATAPNHFFSDKPMNDDNDSQPTGQDPKSNLVWGSGSLLGSALLYSAGWKKTAVMPMIYGTFKLASTLFGDQLSKIGDKTMEKLDKHVDKQVVTHTNIGSSLRARAAASTESKAVYNPESTLFGISDVDFERPFKEGGKKKYPFEVAIEFADQGKGSSGEIKGKGTYVDDDDYFFTHIYIEVKTPNEKVITILEEQEIIDL
eukprot:CAMPEP_0115002692 /NCGR_PEP_ID=MMETSP0216-20121206/18160_1 /TAXON_ID=223996 /ORGANISM="Protocruzia adherens, Strain Boccale" /LENGTH=224 /DNA_ID=CAMNT_0002368341 /DNA_START=30 /DNA_END=704 /DNA_ORIENTATION=+